MPQFYDLDVVDVKKTIRDAVVVTLRPSDAARAAFAFQPGQYLTFRRAFEGEELRRSYSICAGLDEDVLQVGIKKVAGGAFSHFANEVLQPGDTLEVMPPQGTFTVPLEPKAAHNYLGFAGGSGVTPVLSILRSVLAREPQSTFTLVYANRGVRSIMFREELDDLKNRYMGRLNVLHILEQDAQEIELFTGRVTEDKCAALFRHWIDVKAMDMAFICGPEPMMLGIAAALEAHGLSKQQIKFELFSGGQLGRARRVDEIKSAAEGAAQTQARITLDGATLTISMDKSQSVLEAALANAMDAPFACRAGVCSTCRCKVLDGEVEMAVNHALEDDEVARGYVLSCQAYPLTDAVTVDYDQ